MSGKTFQKERESAFSITASGGVFCVPGSGFLTEANARPLQTACGRGGTSRLPRKNAPTFAEKRPHFPWKTSRLLRKTCRTYQTSRTETAFSAQTCPFFVQNLFPKAPLRPVGKTRRTAHRILANIREPHTKDERKEKLHFKSKALFSPTLLPAFFRIPSPSGTKRRILDMPGCAFCQNVTKYIIVRKQPS